VIEGHQWLDVVFEQEIDQTVVEGEAAFLAYLITVGEEAWPGDGKAVGVNAELLEQLNVLLVAVVVVAGDVAVLTVANFAGCPREGVPNLRPTTIFVDRSLDLVRRGGDSPDKALRERHELD
jgi:hypothetical protein